MAISYEVCRECLFITLIVTTAVHLCYYLFIFSRLAFYKLRSRKNSRQPVSVIICAKNEVKNLRKYLPIILDQSYPDFEVIVVNDCSWDETEEYLKEIKPQYPNLVVSTIREQDRYRHGKKFALTLGIKAAKNEILLLTDADCIPASSNWISLIESAYNSATNFVLGYGGYMREKGLLNALIRFDTFQIGMQYLSFALSGSPYMGVGRNLSYNKSIFFKSKGFASHNHLFSGDDDLFINENATSQNTRIEIDKQSLTISEPKRTFKEWFKQKARHGTTANYYKAKHKILLSLFTLSNIAFFILLITLLVTKYKWQFVAGIYLFKLLVQWTIGFMSANKLDEKSLMWLYPLHEIASTVFLQPIFYISSLFTKQRAWK